MFTSLIKFIIKKLKLYQRQFQSKSKSILFYKKLYAELYVSLLPFMKFLWNILKFFTYNFHLIGVKINI